METLNSNSSTEMTYLQLQAMMADIFRNLISLDRKYASEKALKAKRYFVNSISWKKNEKIASMKPVDMLDFAPKTLNEADTEWRACSLYEWLSSGKLDIERDHVIISNSIKEIFEDFKFEVCVPEGWDDDEGIQNAKIIGYDLNNDEIELETSFKYRISGPLNELDFFYKFLPNYDRETRFSI